MQDGLDSLTLSTGEEVTIASGKSLLDSAAQDISLFAQNAGAKRFAPKGKVELQAQSDAMELKAQQGAKITSAGIGIGIGKQDEGGEGAVPTLSGQAPTAHSKFSANLKGFVHSTSYDNKFVRAVTAHSMISIAKRAKILC
ncbi:DUF2345 domain-containing protein [Pseudomonas alliivorans]|nr:DUF2345 domain-containing protein [Pseudomonas alliivorans]